MARATVWMLAVVCVLGLATAGVFGERGDPAPVPPEEAKDQAEPAKPEKLVITTIPDDREENLRKHFSAIAKLIEKETGIPTEFVNVRDYTSALTALATGQAHVAWFGPVTIAQAHIQMKGEMQIIACRDIDKTFVSYFIAGKESGVPKVESLKELAEHAKAKEWTLTFGSKSSTTAHLMPRQFFVSQNGKEPEEIFKSVAFTGNMQVILDRVSEGTFTIGTIGKAVYNRASDELKAKAPVIYTTPNFHNYGMAARTDLGDELTSKVRSALLKMHESDQGKDVLKYLGAERFEEAEMKDWKGYVELIESGVDIGG